MIHKQKFDWNAFMENEDMAVHCQTQKESDQFVKLAIQHGINFDVNIDFYDVYEERTVYYSDGYYGDIDHANEAGYPIVMFSKYDFTDETERTEYGKEKV